MRSAGDGIGTLAVAVSGGPDSVALLRGLAAAWRRGLPRLAVLCIDHGVRGVESAADVAFVARLAAELSLPFRALRAESARVWKNGVASEARLRTERFRLLGEGAREFGAGAIYLAHHKDDQIETIVLAALRRAGLRGLAGMRRRRALDATDPNSPRVVRPWLGVPRAALLSWLSERALPYRTDPSNFDRRFLRNRIRHETLPALRESLGPGLDDALFRLGRLAAILETRARRRGRTQAHDSDALFARAVELLGAPLPRDAGRALVARASHPAAREIDVGKMRRLLVGNGRLELVPPREVGTASHELLREFEGSDRARRIFLAMERLRGERLRAHLSRRNVLYLDADCIVGTLRSRSRVPGDRFRPFGATTASKLKDLFIERRVPRDTRALLRIYLDDQGIVAVEGLGIASRVALTAATSRVLRITGAAACRMADAPTRCK